MTAINLMISLEMLILLHRTFCQYESNQFLPRYYHHQPYTRAAYFEQYYHDEYTKPIKSRKMHKRKKYNDYFISAEMEYGHRKLKCKCTCNQIHVDKPIPEYEQADPCCQSYCDYSTHTSSFFYTSPPTINYPPSILHPITFDLSGVGQFFPWMTWSMFKTPTSTPGTATPSSIPATAASNTDISTTKTSTTEAYTTTNDKPTTSSHKENKDKEETTTDKNQNSDRNKDNDKNKDSENDKVTDKNDKDNNKNENKDSSTTTTTAATEKDKKDDSTTITTKTDMTTQSTSPYTEGEIKRLIHYLPKKKPCLRNNCLHNEENKRVGSYYKNDLVERPTVGSYFNRNRRSHNAQRQFSNDKRHYGLIPIPDHLALKFMNDLYN